MTGMMFGKIFLLCNVLCCFLQRCSVQNGEDVSDTALFLNEHKILISSISEDEYKKAAQGERLNIDTTLIKKNKDELVLSIAGNKKVILRDSLANSDNTEQVTYNYIGHFKEAGLYVIKVQYYETGEYILINDKTGVKTKVWGEPKLSPDKKHIVCASNAVGYDIMPNGIQMWLIQKGNLNLDWEYKQEQWGPDGIIWENENIFYFTKHIPDFISKSKKEERHYAKILVKKRW
jgi:hypothetical protein